MKDLNFKKMATDMSFHDKAKIIFADWNHRRETHGKERIISVQEEDAMVEDIRKNNQIGQLNLLTDLYNMSNMLALDMQGEILGLRLAKMNVHWLVLAIHLNGRANNRIEELLSMVCARDTKKIRDLKEKMKKNYFEDSLSFLHDDQAKVSEPNLRLQEFLKSLIVAHKTLRKLLYSLDYLLDKAGIDFLSKEAKALSQEAQNEIKYVEDLEGLLHVVIVYKKYLDLGLMQKDNFHFPIVLELIKDHKKVLELTDEEKQEEKRQIDQYISRQN